MHTCSPYRRIGFLAALTLALVAILTPLALAAPAPLPRIIYGFDREYPPFSFEDPGGKAVGFEVEIVEAIFAGKANLVKRPMQWSLVPLELSSGTITVTTGMVRSAQRDRMYAFANRPTFLLPISIFTKNYNRYPDASFMRGQTVAVEAGSYYHRALVDFQGVNVKTYQGKVAPLRALYLDEVAGYCGAPQLAYYHMERQNYTGISTIGTPLGVVEMYIAVNRDRGDVLKMVNDGLASIMASGEYDRIYRKWFVTDPAPDRQEEMIRRAQDARLTAYAPYSKAGMGAAILTATGSIFTGSTLENADARLSSSALMVAAGKAASAGELEMRSAVLVDKTGKVIPPSADDCQFLYEFGRGITVITEENGVRRFPMLAELLANPVLPAQLVISD